MSRHTYPVDWEYVSRKLNDAQDPIEAALNDIINVMLELNWLEDGIAAAYQSWSDDKPMEYEIIIDNVEFGDEFPGIIPDVPERSEDDNYLEYDSKTSAILWHGVAIQPPKGKNKVLWQSVVNLLAASKNLSDSFDTL